MSLAPEKVFYTYEQIHLTMKSLASRLVDDNHFFDVIITIASGGFVPARILKTYFDVPIYVIYMSLYSNNDNKMIEGNKNLQPVFSHLDSDVAGKRILLLDEIDDTRTTLDICSRFLLAKDPKQLVVAAMHNKLVQKTGKIPDNIKYYAGSDVEDKWIVYPWEMLDPNLCD